MIYEWIKSMIKSDTALKLNSNQHRPQHKHTRNRTRQCKRYNNPKRRGHNVRIGNKFSKSIRRLNFICTTFPSPSSSKPSDIRNRPQKFPVDTVSFVIGIDNHTSTKIPNKFSHFIGIITPVKGRMVKDFVGVAEVKGDGMLLWKIEDND